MPDGYTLLIVDDESDVRAAIRRSLHVPGYTIYEASSAEQALDIIASTHIDALVSDYSMGGMTGLDLLQQVRIAHPHIVRVLLTACADVHIALRAINEGAVHRFLLKPWDRLDLRGMIRMALHANDTGQHARFDALQR